MRRGREVNVGSPYLIQRADGGPYHAGQGLDALELTEIRFKESFADSIPKGL